MNLNKVKEILKNIKWYEYIFAIILLVLPMIHVSYGLDLTDTSYSIGNFEQFKDMNPTWSIATFGANILGMILTKLPGGHSWLGMNIYTSIFLSVVTFAVYLLIRDKVKPMVAFMGEFIALSLCWAPHTVLYHYMSYYFLTIATLLLLYGLQKGSKILMLIAGLVLGFNVFVRFPNIVDCALILCVWLYGILTKKKFKQVLVETLICIGGFAAGCVINLLIVTISYGPTAFYDMIVSLFGMTASASGYTPKSMVWGIINHFLIFIKPFIIYAGIVVVFGSLGLLAKKKWVKYLLIVPDVLIFIAYLWWARRNGYYSFDYEQYQSIVMISVVFLYVSIVVSLLTVFVSKDTFERVAALAVLITIGVTPLGSNNGLFPVFNNMFLIAPFTLMFIYNRLAKGKLKGVRENIAVIMSVFIIFMIVQTGIFGVVFIFRDPGFLVKNSVKLEGNAVTKGMHTNAENAKKLEGIIGYAGEKSWQGKPAIIYANMPGLSYVLSMPSALGHTWADLPSFTYGEMKERMEALDGSEPIIVSKELVGDISVIDTDDDEKLVLLKEYVIANDYRLDYADGDIEVYIR